MTEWKNNTFRIKEACYLIQDKQDQFWGQEINNHNVYEFNSKASKYMKQTKSI